MTILNSNTKYEVYEKMISTEQFRDAAGHFASGVTVIGTLQDQELFGTTASAVLSLSMDPPMMLVCLNRSSSTHDVIAENGEFSISILNREQSHLARHFASKAADKYDGIEVDYIHGLPVIHDAITAMTCTVESTTAGGTHTVFLGRVTALQTTDGEPLAYYRGGFGSFVTDGK